MDPFEEFKSKPKFLEDDELHYPGLSNPAIRPVLIKKLEQAADDFKETWSSGKANANQYLKNLQAALKRFQPLFSELDTEDRERISAYLEDLMEIVEMDASSEILDDFINGNDPALKP